ncbi:MAG: hypothetical protein J7K72_03600 [Candidatus Aenigmarchaeota archaeon]|nr:hypothetical protein [Candidatus Aenigmarchaeota archaeon]
MKIAEFLRRGIIRVAGGVIVNYFKIGGRRHTLYFGEIPAKYFLLCERHGFGDELRRIGQKWMYLFFSTLTPSYLRRLSPERLLNNIVKKMWANLGLIDDFHVEREGDTLCIEVKREGTTELIGKNSFQVGFHEGVLNAFYNKETEVVNVRQTKNRCIYKFRLLPRSFKIEGKSKDEYRRLNSLPRISGVSIQDMLKNKVFYLKGQRLYFRGKIIYPVENTVIHLFSNKGLMLDKVSCISYDFFQKILKRDASENEKLRLLKNLMQVMGWGVFNIIKSNDMLRVNIENPPYGLQKEKDNWDFLIKMILGYLMAVNKDYKIEEVKEGYKFLGIVFST